MSALVRLWRWFTLADVAVRHHRQDSARGCDYCGGHVTCQLSVNAVDRQTCGEHLDNALRDFAERAGPR